VIVVPAMEVRGGKVVRRKQGELREEHVYGSDPVGVARRWQEEGAARLHLLALARSCGMALTAAGGLSMLDQLRRLRELEALGVDEVVVGKALYEKRFTLAQAMEVVR
jgi:phosphoribosylformimino-5-aminoimidazole carboxamide ribotide isomerase